MNKNEDNKPSENIYIIDNGIVKLLKYNTIKKYILAICQKMNVQHLDTDKIAKNVYPKLKNVNTITEVDDQIVMSATEMVTDHYDYPCIATWILITDLHNNTHDDYLKVVRQLRNNINKKGKNASIISEGYFNFVEKHCDEINKAFHYERDYDISVFGYRTLEKAYLKKLVDGKIIERPQHLYMRVAIALHYRTERLDRIFETYELLSKGYFTHATPTLFNAGTTHEQLSSCFLLGIDDDMEAIGECWKDCAVISKYAGGIGINVTNVRVDGAYINSTQGRASGLRLLTVFDKIAKYADQGGKRAGSIAIYIEPWHGDVFFFLDLKKNNGAETERARDLFLALMVNDIFMRRVEADDIWSLMCPSECPNLLNKFGAEFTQIYEQYEAEGKYLKQIKARDLWFRIMESQIESGVPYIVFKDAVNYKSNQINIGVVNGSNLCVSGDTMILTSKGYVNIRSNHNEKVKVWNGEEFSEVTIKKTGIDQNMMEIDFSNGSTLKCTHYHKFFIIAGDRNQKVEKVCATQLKVGDKLIRTEYPVITVGKNNFKYPYTHGLFCADGTYNTSKTDPKQCVFNPTTGSNYCKRHIDHHQQINKNLILDKSKCHALSYAKHPRIDLYGAKQALCAYLDMAGCGNIDEKNDKLQVRLYHDIAEKYKVPINYNIDIKLRWFEGLLDGDGCVCIDGTKKSLQIGSINKKFLNNVKYLLQTLGCDPKVTVSYEKTKKMLPDGKGGNKLYNLQTLYRLLVSSNDTYNLVQLGLNPHRLDLDNLTKPTIASSRYITVKKISYLAEKEDTYCFTEPKKNCGIFNGIICLNCSEILEVSTSEEYAVCFTADTNILTKNGIKKIIECDGEDVFSYYDNDENLVKHPHYEKAKLIKNGTKTVYALKTSGNKNIESTKDHPFLVLDENRCMWKKLRDIKPGDKIMTPRISTMEKYIIDKKLFREEYMAAGWMFGDNSMTREGWGTYVGASKRISEKIRYASPINQASFLSAYFSADGCVIFNNNKLYVNITSGSKDLLYDVQSLLYPFGIRSKIKIGRFDCVLSIHGEISIENFKKYIGFKLCPDKNKKLKKLISKSYRSHKVLADYSKVISIKKIGKKEVYDLSLENGHNFIANGHVVHNCNLASICLPKFVIYINGRPVYNYQELYRITRTVTRNLNNVIDINFYPVEKTKISNLKHRPIGIGIQGLADLFAMFKIAFDSELARDLNKKISETIYFGALTESMTIAKENGHYQTFRGSPLSMGKFQFDLWNLDRKNLSGMWDWDGLEKDIVVHGVANSLVTTCMPTASTSQIMGNNECLTADTKIFIPNGLTKEIKDFANGDNVIGWNNKKLEKSHCYEKLNKGTKDTLTIKLFDGREIKCTNNHKFLTYDKKWVTASNINIGDELMASVEGTYDKNYGDEHNYSLAAGEYIFSMETEDARYNTLAFARIVGYILADGNIYFNKETEQYIIDIYLGTKYDVECMSDDIIKLEGIAPNIRDSGRRFGLRPHAKLTNAIVSLKNITTGAKLPDFVLDKKCPKSVIREFVAGYFGGDGLAPFLSEPSSSSSNPTISCIKLLHHKDYLYSINKLMVKLEMSVSNKYSKTMALSVAPGTDYLEKIGFRYCIEKSLRLTAANAYWRYRKNTPKNAISVVDFMRKINCTSWFDKNKYIIDRNDTQLPYLKLSVVGKNENGPCQVWDINVKNIHSFVANGIVAHNCFEPYTENIYTRATLAGDYYIINKYLMKDLMELDLWNEDMVDLIKYYEGSIANIPGIPDHIKLNYRTVWEIPQKSLIEMAADRGPFVDQTQSMNIFIAKADFARLNSCLFDGWKKGLKTGIYYLRSKAASEANKFGIDIDKIKELEAKYNISPIIDPDTLPLPLTLALLNPETLPSEFEAKPIPICKFIPKNQRKPGDCLSCDA
jgi:ribonucleotide reductase alpha subunit